MAKEPLFFVADNEQTSTTAPNTAKNNKRNNKAKNKKTAWPKFDKLPGRGLYTESARQLRLDFIRNTTDSTLTSLGNTSFEAHKLNHNVESFVGSVEVPVGVAGPLKINGEYANGVFYAPIATSEGALVASLSRGAYALSCAGGVTTRVMGKRMMRVPMFLFENMIMAADFVKWIEDHKLNITQEAEKHSNYASLVELTAQAIGRAVHVHYVYETGDAAGQNMTTTCTWHSCLWIVERIRHHSTLTIDKFVIEGGLSSDKKASYLSLIKGRGFSTQAEAVLPEKIVRRVLKTTPWDIKEIWTQFATAATGAGLVGLNVNVANAIAGIFTATGQDIASVHESSLANTLMDVTRDGDLYICMSIPSLPIGTVGGGTDLADQRECLAMLGCQGAGKAKKLAEIIVAYCLALDLSTTAAIVAGHFATAHEMLGRNRKINHIKLSDLDEPFFQSRMCIQLNDKSINVQNVVQLKTHENDSSLITEMTSRKIRKTVGLFPYDVIYDTQNKQQQQRIMVKIKPTTNEIIGALNQLASMCDTELAEEFEKYKFEVGLSGTDKRELAVYAQTDPRFTQYIPKIYGLYEEESREAYIIIQELLTDTELMDTANDVSGWQDQHRRAAISGIADCHAIWFERTDELIGKSWIGKTPNCQSRLKLSNLYSLLYLHASHEFPHWIGNKELKRVESILSHTETWWKKVESMPKSLVHNDFNPRNITFRKINKGVRLCVYDWELATIHIPQVDLVELLAYTLANDVKKDYVFELVEFHRICLMKSTGKNIDPKIWREGFRYAVWDFFLSRMSLYLMTHTFRQFDFLERVFNTLWCLLDIVDETD